MQLARIETESGVSAERTPGRHQYLKQTDASNHIITLPFTIPGVTFICVQRRLALGVGAGR
jgi:hypothetical protein